MQQSDDCRGVVGGRLEQKSRVLPHALRCYRSQYLRKLADRRDRDLQIVLQLGGKFLRQPYAKSSRGVHQHERRHVRCGVDGLYVILVVHRSGATGKKVRFAAMSTNVP